VKSTRNHLVGLRGHGWQPLLAEVFAFCDKHDIDKLELEESYINSKNKRKKNWYYQSAPFPSGLLQ
jgi:hypothetical protein